MDASLRFQDPVPIKPRTKHMAVLTLRYGGGGGKDVGSGRMANQSGTRGTHATNLRTDLGMSADVHECQQTMASLTLRNRCATVADGLHRRPTSREAWLINTRAKDRNGGRCGLDWWTANWLCARTGGGGA